MAAGPVIRHSNEQLRRRKFLPIVEKFAEELRNGIKKMSEDKTVIGGANWQIAEGKDLLELRRRLVAKVKEGMLERKDMELEIAFLSMMIWFARLEKERRDRITDLW